MPKTVQQQEVEVFRFVRASLFFQQQSFVSSFQLSSNVPFQQPFLRENVHSTWEINQRGLFECRRGSTVQNFDKRERNVFFTLLFFHPERVV